MYNQCDVSLWTTNQTLIVIVVAICCATVIVVRWLETRTVVKMKHDKSTKLLEEIVFALQEHRSPAP